MAQPLKRWPPNFRRWRIGLSSNCLLKKICVPQVFLSNTACLQHLKNIKWRNYPYSFILVLGSGPQDSSRLSSLGVKRADVAAQLFLQHKAPLIILSGGHVHPLQTPYCEAIEMKKYVME